MASAWILLAVTTAMLALTITANAKALPGHPPKYFIDVPPSEMLARWDALLDSRRSTGLGVPEFRRRGRRDLEGVIKRVREGAEALGAFSQMVDDLKLSDEQIMSMVVDIGLPAFRSWIGL